MQHSIPYFCIIAVKIECDIQGLFLLFLLCIMAMTVIKFPVGIGSVKRYFHEMQNATPSPMAHYPSAGDFLVCFGNGQINGRSCDRNSNYFRALILMEVSELNGRSWIIVN